MKIRINFVDWGIANRFSNLEKDEDLIEIHRDLINFPELLSPIIMHELSHTSKGWSLKDFKIDFWESTTIKRLDLYRFMLSRPKTWIQILPFYWTPKKGFIIDVNKTLMYAFILSIFVFDFLILKRFVIMKGGI